MLMLDIGVGGYYGGLGRGSFFFFYGVYILFIVLN